MKEINENFSCRGRSFEAVAKVLQLTPGDFENKVVYDLSCGKDELRAGLGRYGVQANVTRFDRHTNVSRDPLQTNPQLTQLPVEEGSGDIVIAHWSFPLWAKSPEAIDRFYAECKRITAPRGMLAVFPIAAIALHGESPESNARLQAARKGAEEIRKSPEWENLLANRLILKAQKLPSPSLHDATPPFVID